MSEASSGSGVSNSLTSQEVGNENSQVRDVCRGATHGSIVELSNACPYSSLYSAICGLEGRMTEMVLGLPCAR